MYVHSGFKKKIEIRVARGKKFRWYHTTYAKNNMGQKYEGNCGLWVLNEII